MKSRACLGIVGATGVSLVLLAGCAQENRSVQGPQTSSSMGAMAPVAAGPEGFRWNSEDPRPALTPIDLSEPGRAAWSTGEATIIDTRSFPVQIQDIRSDVVDMRMKNNLPPHQRPKMVTAVEVVDDVEIGSMLGDSRASLDALFPGMSQTPWTPPDVTLAVGPNHIVSTVNMAVAFHDKQGNLQFQANLDSSGDPGFFEVVGASTFTFDPKCFYDHLAQRYVIVALEVYGSTQAWICIAVSDDSDPHGVWYKYRTNAVIAGGGTQTYWVDYPGFGYDNNAYYVTGNLFGLSASGFGGTLFRIYPKTPLLSGSPVTFADIRDAGVASVQVAQCFGSNIAPFFTSIVDNTNMRIQAIRNPLTTPTISTDSVSVPPFSYPSGDAPNPGGLVDVLDGRIMNAHWRDGKLYFGHGVWSSGKAVARWYQVNTNNWPSSGSPTLAQSGTLNLGGTMASFFPAIGANKHGDVGLVVAACNSTTVPSVYVAARRQTDAPGTLGAATLVATGTAGANGRWGDYFDITTDPNDDATFWYIGQYQTPAGWQSVIGSFIVTCAANVNGDLDLDVLDFLDFINAFGSCEGQPAPCSAGGISADFNGDTIVDILDLLDFLDAYGRGC
ncbi:MAG: hypothetical protein KF705_11525 [Phycisphaeraceae bacterium]|nr:hypothetical protein [Phycisphaeraceae bacterium]